MLFTPEMRNVHALSASPLMHANDAERSVPTVPAIGVTADQAPSSPTFVEYENESGLRPPRGAFHVTSNGPPIGAADTVATSTAPTAPYVTATGVDHGPWPAEVTVAIRAVHPVVNEHVAV